MNFLPADRRVQNEDEGCHRLGRPSSREARDGAHQASRRVGWRRRRVHPAMRCAVSRIRCGEISRGKVRGGGEPLHLAASRSGASNGLFQTLAIKRFHVVQVGSNAIGAFRKRAFAAIHRQHYPRIVGWTPLSWSRVLSAGWAFGLPISCRALPAPGTRDVARATSRFSPSLRSALVVGAPGPMAPDQAGAR
jgi:hypothetical protein